VWINVFYHIIRKNDLSGGIPVSQLCDVTTYLNSIYNSYGIFINSNESDFIDNDAFYTLTTFNNSAQMFATNAQSGAINIYLIEGVENELSGVLGCAARIPSGIFFIQNKVSQTPIIAHELGHCLGLFHTFRGLYQEVGQVFCAENPNGSNCSTCGDFICDTPADPGLAGNIGSNCEFTGSYIYSPDTRNIMSYSNPTCPTRFSPNQATAMINTINSPYLSSTKNTGLSLPNMVGDNAVCTGSSFSIANIRAGFFVSNWSSSNTSVATINSSGYVSKVTDGITTITAQISNGCQSYFVSKEISVGVPIKGTYRYGTFVYPVNAPSTGIAVSSSTPTVSITLVPAMNSTNFSWSILSRGGYNSFSPNGANASMYLSGGSYLNLKCVVSNNQCGSSSVEFNCYNYSYGYNYYRMAVSPNPTSEELSLTSNQIDVKDLIVTNEKLLQTKNINNIPVKLLDKLGQIVGKGKLNNGEFKLNLSNIRNGIYFLHISEGEDLVIKTIIVQH
jgi:Secretion system C-terminal sorting domain/Pregnancy-associated plasma protein-A